VRRGAWATASCKRPAGSHAWVTAQVSKRLAGRGPREAQRQKITAGVAPSLEGSTRLGAQVSAHSFHCCGPCFAAARAAGCWLANGSQQRPAIGAPSGAAARKGWNYGSKMRLDFDVVGRSGCSNRKGLINPMLVR